MTDIDYEVIGYNGDDGEWCAGSSDRDEAINYAVQYLEDYERVYVFSVIKKLDCSFQRKSK